MAIARRYFTRGNTQRKVSARITIEKSLGRDGMLAGAFIACIRVGKSGWYHGASIRKQNVTCEFGKNPRLALSRAFTKLGKELKWRGEHGRGAFAGHRRK